MSKIDFKKDRKALYQPSAKAVSVVNVPAMNFLMIDGVGDPGRSKEFGESMESLYPLAYTLKFMSKLGPTAQDYVVPPLEGLWWADDMNAFIERRRDEWRWTLMIMQPDFVSEEMFAEAVDAVRKKKNPALLESVRFECFEEGESAQILHVGPFEEEGPNVTRVHEKIEELGKQRFNKHHEIYLSDPRRTAPEKLKTVLRQAMR
ncbi:GyrI-like domain-containing protein [Pelagicoccus sp. SDUM812002]|uniref:GyrI-like domain-containing protein n=1 Tax=Pelagicoccus sp. SDUM812002 TaxID=3041266 RepID=UPI00280F3653|nr:GyrI-like domain-containing protein [Pelagicoccus sp. SDUM812002]MDQ8187177.1 GyrI-like domain-containing protein [Pelagicoccus sp. SDUM812002]